MSSKREPDEKRKENKQSGRKKSSKEKDHDLSQPSCSGYKPASSSTTKLPNTKKILSPLPSTSFYHPKCMYDPSTPPSEGVRKRRTKSGQEEDLPYDNINLKEFSKIYESPLYPQIKEMKKKSFWNRKLPDGKKSTEGVTRMTSDEVDLLAFDKSYDDMIRKCLPSDSDEEYNEYLKTSKKGHKAININRSSFTLPDECLLTRETVPSSSSDSSLDSKPKSKKSTKNVKRRSKLSGVKKSTRQESIKAFIGSASKTTKEYVSTNEDIDSESSLNKEYDIFVSEDAASSSTETTYNISKSASSRKTASKNIPGEHSSIKDVSSQDGKSIAIHKKMKNKLKSAAVKQNYCKQAQKIEKKIDSGNKKVKCESFSKKPSTKVSKSVSCSKNAESEVFVSKDASSMHDKRNEVSFSSRNTSSGNDKCILGSKIIGSISSIDKNVCDSALSGSRNITREKPRSKHIKCSIKCMPSPKVLKRAYEKGVFDSVDSSVSSSETTKLEKTPDNTISTIKDNVSLPDFQVEKKVPSVNDSSSNCEIDKYESSVDCVSSVSDNLVTEEPRGQQEQSILMSLLASNVPNGNSYLNPYPASCSEVNIVSNVNDESLNRVCSNEQENVNTNSDSPTETAAGLDKFSSVTASYELDLLHVKEVDNRVPVVRLTRLPITSSSLCSRPTNIDLDKRNMPPNLDIASRRKLITAEKVKLLPHERAINGKVLRVALTKIVTYF